METTTSTSGEGRGAEIVFFDMETTIPNRAGERFWVLEFGAIVVCPRKLVELESYCTLIRPRDLTVVSLNSGKGITRKAVAAAPMFEDVADKIFDILNGRVWAGHNIQRFDCARIKEVFADIGRPAPVPVGMIDSLGVLKQKFGKRAGNMKMATLAAYFGLGQQKHRSLEDVRMNLEVLKHCATVLFLESSLPAVLANNSQGFSTVVTRSRSNGQLSYGEETSRRKRVYPVPKAPVTTGSEEGLTYTDLPPLHKEADSRFKHMTTTPPETVVTRSRSNGQLSYGEEISRRKRVYPEPEAPVSMGSGKGLTYTDLPPLHKEADSGFRHMTTKSPEAVSRFERNPRFGRMTTRSPEAISRFERITTRSQWNNLIIARRPVFLGTRNSPHNPLGYHRAVPYARGKFGNMTEMVKDLLCKAQNKPPLTSFLKHSHSLVR